MNRIFAIGDIHGCLDKLNNLLTNLNLTSDDMLIFGGDYVDRGPDSYGVIERLLQLNRTNKCVFLAGNHDVKFFDDDKFRSDYKPAHRYSFWDQGAKETYNSYINANKVPSVHYPFYKMLEPYHVLELNGEKHLFVHGGYNRHKLIEEQKNNTTLWWDRDLLGAAIAHSKRIPDSEYPFKNKDNFKYIYVGHTPVQYWGYNEPQLFANVWALDTGVGKYKDAELYALEINSQQLYK